MILMSYHHDCCPAHYAMAVLTARQVSTKIYLIANFLDGWIGCEGVVNWPGFTPLDFLLWGTLKERVYKDALTMSKDKQLWMHAQLSVQMS